MPRRRPGALAVAGVLVAVTVLAFVLALTSAQSTAREDIEQRFRERAEVSAALTSSLFASTASTPNEENRRVIGASKIPQEGLDQIARTGRYPYAVVLSANGRVLAASSGTPAAVTRALDEKPPWVSGVIAGAPFGLSGVLASPTDGGQVLEYAVPYRIDGRLRILVSSFEPELISSFLGSYLESLPNSDSADAYVVDSAGVVVGTTDRTQPPAQPLRAPGALPAVRRAADGEYDGGGTERYLTSARVTGSEWQVVLTATTKDLYLSISGARTVVPWIVFSAFALAALLALVLLRGVLRSSGALADANADLEARNDDVERMNQALEARAAELARSNADLQEFASIASHDLQEPLRKVQFFGDQIVERHGEGLPDEVVDHLDRMRRAAGRMRALTDDLLTFSRVSTKGTPFVPVDLREVAEGVLYDLEPRIAAAGGTVRVGDLPTIDADPTQMRQLLQNLIANGLKFARPDVAPEVSVGATVAEDRCELVVQDNGIGFEPQYAERIFRIFERLHGRSEYPGTGIGLALCRKIAERHGGTIVATGVPSEGARFTVRLPVHQATAASTPEPEDRMMSHA